MPLSLGPGHICGLGQYPVRLSLFFVGLKWMLPVCTRQDPRSDIHVNTATESAVQEQQDFFLIILSSDLVGPQQHLSAKD